jgi:hypothetical protein
MGINSVWKVDLTTAFIQLLKGEKLNYINPLNGVTVVVAVS